MMIRPSGRLHSRNWRSESPRVGAFSISSGTRRLYGFILAQPLKLMLWHARRRARQTLTAAQFWRGMSATSVEAFAKVSGNPLPVFLDEVLVQYVEPALTPSILILFGFSISLGLLKQLQMTAGSAGVLYQEPEEYSE